MDILHMCLNVANASVTFYEQFGFEESWSFTSVDGTTENRYVAHENGVEIQLSETEGEDTFEQRTA